MNLKLDAFIVAVLQESGNVGKDPPTGFSGDKFVMINGTS